MKNRALAGQRVRVSVVGRVWPGPADRRVCRSPAACSRSARRTRTEEAPPQLSAAAPTARPPHRRPAPPQLQPSHPPGTRNPLANTMQTHKHNGRSGQSRKPHNRTTPLAEVVRVAALASGNSAAATASFARRASKASSCAKYSLTGGPGPGQPPIILVLSRRVTPKEPLHRRATENREGVIGPPAPCWLP